MLTLAKLYAIKKDAAKQQGGTPLKIDNNAIKFFNPVLQAGSEFLVLDEQTWQLRFFLNSPFEQTFHVKFSQFEKPDLEPKVSYPDGYLMAKLCFALVNHQFQSTHCDEEMCQKACKVVRGTHSIKPEHLTFRAAHAIHADGRGLMMLSQYANQIEQFKRVVLLYTLAKAYLQAMTDISLKVAEISSEEGDDSSALHQLYFAATTFNMRFMFRQPVQHDKSDLPLIWRQIADAQEIEANHRELYQQLQHYYQMRQLQEAESQRLARERQERERAAEEKARRKAERQFLFIGIALSLLSLISVVADGLQLWQFFHQ